MFDSVFSPMEIDAIGEIMNISLGSSATAVSNLLNHRVDITTPRVEVVDADELNIGELDPAVGVVINYVTGLEGSNIMMLKRTDVKAIVDILLGEESSEEDFELNELSISAVCEVMNQMMGASATALSDFLGRSVNISTPKALEVANFDEFKKENFPPDAGTVVAVRFMLSIENAVESEFLNVISVQLASELIAGFELAEGGEEEDEAVALTAGKLSQEEVERLMQSQMAEAAPAPAPSSGGGMMSQEEIERLMSGGLDAAPEPAPAPAPSGGKLSQEEIERLMSGGLDAAPEPAPAPQQPPMQQMPDGQMPAGYPPYGMYPGYYPPPGYYPQAAPPDQKLITTQALHMPQMDAAAKLPQEQAQNLDLIMSVPLEVSVEIGRTSRKVQEILTFSKGSLVVLDKLAGDQVDLFVNGQCIAKGDVVVVGDNFGIRVTEVLTPAEPGELLQR